MSAWTWQTWMQHHGSLFAFRSDEDLGMLARWTALFARAGFTPEELASASDSMAMAGEVPKFRDALHMNALRRMVLASRAERTKTAPQPEESAPLATAEDWKRFRSMVGDLTRRTKL